MSTANDIFVNTVTILGTATEIATPFLAVYNPAAAVLVQQYGPLVESFILSEDQIIVNWKKDATRDDMIKLLQASMSTNWNIKPLETPEDKPADTSTQFVPEKPAE